MFKTRKDNGVAKNWVVLIWWKEGEEFKLFTEEGANVFATLVGNFLEEGDQLHQLVVGRVHEPEINRFICIKRK
jgi:hypothetical protein